MSPRSRTVALLATVTLVLGACAETIIEDPSADVQTASVGSRQPTAITAPTGSTDELLAAMAAEMSGLGNEIIDDGRTERETLAQIDAIWAALRPTLESTYPELVNGFDTTVEMAHTAVSRIRPADADKAYRVLLELLGRVDG